MQNDILEKIVKLGGNVDAVDPKTSLNEQLAAITFHQVLFDDFWECYGVDEFREEHRELYEKDHEAFVESLLDYLLANNDDPRGQGFWEYVHFTPMTEGTKECADWDGAFHKYELTEIREVVGEGDLEFAQIMHVFGFPDHYYICLSDPNPENPTVFSTDHEVFFREITNEGSFSEFLDKMLTRDKLKEVVVEYMNNND